jgi:hypothetical protein
MTQTNTQVHVAIVAAIRRAERATRENNHELAGRYLKLAAAFCDVPETEVTAMLERVDAPRLTVETILDARSGELLDWDSVRARVAQYREAQRAVLDGRIN